MSSYNQLPIYHKTREFVIMLNKLVVTFNKSYKYNLGEELRKKSLKLLSLIYKANTARDTSEKVRYLTEFVDIFEIIKISLSLATDLYVFDKKRTLTYGF